MIVLSALTSALMIYAGYFLKIALNLLSRIEQVWGQRVCYQRAVEKLASVMCDCMCHG